jgi:secreted Zn-dependent insulinase-like peptidase
LPLSAELRKGGKLIYGFSVSWHLVSQGKTTDNRFMKMMAEKAREKFRKIIEVMRSATLGGERSAAREAAARMATAFDMTLEEAIAELDGKPVKLDPVEQESLRQHRSDIWASTTLRMMNRGEAEERYRVNAARTAAQERGLDERERKVAEKPQAIPTRKPSYLPNTQDRHRLISVLLRDGLSLARVAELADASTNEVARIYLLNRARA